MLLQTNSYIVPRDKRAEHERLVRRFRQAFARLGCEQFEVFEQVGANWSNSEPTGRFVQLMHFRDRRHQQAVQEAERKDPGAQALIQEFCRLINFPYQQQQGLFAVGYYAAMLGAASPPRYGRRVVDARGANEGQGASEANGDGEEHAEGGDDPDAVALEGLSSADVEETVSTDEATPGVPPVDVEADRGL